MTLSWRACIGLPRTLIQNEWALHIVGCSIAPLSRTLELVLCIEPSARAPSTTTFYQQRKLPSQQTMLIEVAGCKCLEPQFQQHVVTVACRCAPRPTSASWLLSVRAMVIDADAATPGRNSNQTVKTVAKLPTEPASLRGPLVACTGRTVYGEISERLQLLRLARSLWRAAGVEAMLIFGSSAVCEAVQQQLPGVRCEQRGSFDVATADRDHHCSPVGAATLPHKAPLQRTVCKTAALQSVTAVIGFCARVASRHRLCRRELLARHIVSQPLACTRSVAGPPMTWGAAASRPQPQRLLPASEAVVCIPTMHCGNPDRLYQSLEAALARYST